MFKTTLLKTIKRTWSIYRPHDITDFILLPQITEAKNRGSQHIDIQAKEQLRGAENKTTTSPYSLLIKRLDTTSHHKVSEDDGGDGFDDDGIDWQCKVGDADYISQFGANIAL